MGTSVGMCARLFTERLNQTTEMVTATTVMSYAIYAVNSPLIGSKMLATLPAVIYGIFRYLYLIYDRADTRSTARSRANRSCPTPTV